MKIAVEQVYDSPTETTHRTTILSIKDIGITESQYPDASGKKPMRHCLEVIFQIDDQFTPDGDPIQYIWKPTMKIRPAAPHKGLKATSLYQLIKALNIDIGKEFETDDLVSKKPLVRFQKSGSKVVISDFPKTMGIEVTEVSEVDELLDEVPGVRLWEESDLPVNPRRSRANNLTRVMQIIEKFQDDFDIEIRALRQGGFALDFVTLSGGDDESN